MEDELTEEILEDIEEQIVLPDEVEEVEDELAEEILEDIEEQVELPDEIEDVEDELTEEINEDIEEQVELPDDIEDVEDELTEEINEDIEEQIELPDEIEEVEDELTEEPADNPMAELKSMSEASAGNENDSFDKLKTLSKKIIDGETVDIGVDVRTEIAELLKLIISTRDRVNEIEPTLATSNEHLPNVLSTLESVSETTEDATLDLMESADGLNNYYQEFVEEINDLEDLVYKKDASAILKKLEKLNKGIENADNLGFNVLQALEFQDITEQKLRKVIEAISDIGARIGALMGFIKLRQEQNPEAVDDASQDDIDKLLSEFGLD